MIRALHIAWALVRVPNLTRHLFLFPILVSLIIVLAQLVTTGLFFKAASHSTLWQRDSTAEKEVDDTNPLRMLLYGRGERRGPLTVCRWVPREDNPTRERPPHSNCKADSLDVALNVPNPQEFVVDDYVSIFEGQIDRLHVCKSCAPDAIIAIDDSGVTHTKSYSMWGIAVLSLAFLPRESLRIERLDTIELTRHLLGPVSLFMPESGRLIDIRVTNPALAFTVNVVPLIIIALWLAVRAHGKVLDYFSKNNVLLPLVAATGKRAFYGALWILTGVRVGCFLAASVPLVYVGLQSFAGEGIYQEISGRGLVLLSWFAAVVPAVGLSTMIASIADLKHRHSMAGFVYRYVPIVMALVGGAVWGFTFVFPNYSAGVVRSVITALPVVGLIPVFIASVTEPPLVSLLLHSVLSLGVLIALMRVNMRWFAAHLEDV
jgi:hypothetical protein